MARCRSLTKSPAKRTACSPWERPQVLRQPRSRSFRAAREQVVIRGRTPSGTSSRGARGRASVGYGCRGSMPPSRARDGLSSAG